MTTNASRYPAKAAIDNRVVELAMRAQRVGRDERGFDLAADWRVEYDFSRGAIGLGGEQTLLHARR